MRKIVLTLVAVLGLGTAAFTAVFTWSCGTHRLFLRVPDEQRVRPEWQDLGPTPGAEKRYAPQGMTWADDALLFANTWNDTLSRVYRIDPETMQPTAEFDMPPEAVHTSGLAWDGAHVWAVDYVSNRCYKIEVEPSFQTRKARVVGSFDTTLSGTSACCFVEHAGERLLAISDFRNSRRTILVRHEEAAAAGSAAGSIAFSYRNEGFSQGLLWDGTLMYEGENKFRGSVINVFDLATAIRYGNVRQALRAQIDAPSRGVEDLAWDGEHLWTSDETVYRFFRAKLDLRP